jgi:hypothetical protein
VADLAARNVHPDLSASLAASLRKAGLHGVQGADPGRKVAGRERP